MNLLFVIDHLSSGGAQRQMVLLACELAARGHRIDLFAYRRHTFYKQMLVDAGVSVIVQTKSYRYSPGTILALRKLIGRKDYDLILSFLSSPNFYSILARMTVASSPPLVVSERSSPDNPNRDFRSRIVEYFYRYSDRIVTNSHHLREHLATTYPWMADRIRTIWNGVDLELFQPRPLPPSDGVLRLVAVGQMGRIKQCHVIIRALAELRDQFGKKVHVTWFARRYPDLLAREQEYFDELNRLVDELNLHDQWDWHAETDNLHERLVEFHGLVHASIVEGLPNAICEGLATGRPIIASDTLDHPRLVREGVTGFLFDPQNTTSLASAIMKLHDLSVEQRQKMSNAARQFAQTELSAGALADSYESLFRDVIGER